MEVTSMLGNITMMEKKPFLHLHANLGRKDMSVVGGHLVAGEVHPFFEVVITPTSNVASRRYDDSKPECDLRYSLTGEQVNNSDGPRRLGLDEVTELRIGQR